MNEEKENSHQHSVNIMSLLITTCAPLQHKSPSHAHNSNVHSPLWLHLLSRPWHYFCARHGNSWQKKIK